MARFPLSEAEILQLARSVAAGLAAHPGDFPSPPVSAERLLAAVDALETAGKEATTARAQAILKTAARQRARKAAVDLVKSDLRYAENHVRFDPIKLGSLGWGGRRPKTPKDAPGEVRLLKMLEELQGAVVLGWKAPVDGGPVAAYKVLRQARKGGGWTVVGTSVKTEITLDNQEAGIEFEYRVIAMNRAGEGRPSNTVRAVL